MIYNCLYSLVVAYMQPPDDTSYFNVSIGTNIGWTPVVFFVVDVGLGKPRSRLVVKLLLSELTGFVPEFQW